MLARRMAEYIASRCDRVYCFPGGTIAPLMDELQSRVDLVVLRSEQGVGFAAGAEARLTRRAQVVMVTSGPGVTNVLTCVADAYFDGVPLVVLCGQVNNDPWSTRRRELRQYGFQECDTVSLAAPICKQALAQSSGWRFDWLGALFRLAETPRMGPVVLELSLAAQLGEARQDG